MTSMMRGAPSHPVSPFFSSLCSQSPEEAHRILRLMFAHVPPYVVVEAFLQRFPHLRSLPTQFLFELLYHEFVCGRWNELLKTIPSTVCVPLNDHVLRSLRGLRFSLPSEYYIRALDSSDCCLALVSPNMRMLYMSRALRQYRNMEEDEYNFMQEISLHNFFNVNTDRGSNRFLAKILHDPSISSAQFWKTVGPGISMCLFDVLLSVRRDVDEVGKSRFIEFCTVQLAYSDVSNADSSPQHLFGEDSPAPPASTESSFSVLDSMGEAEFVRSCFAGIALPTFHIVSSPLSQYNCVRVSRSAGEWLRNSALLQSFATNEPIGSTRIWDHFISLVSLPFFDLIEFQDLNAVRVLRSLFRALYEGECRAGKMKHIYVRRRVVLGETPPEQAEHGADSFQRVTISVESIFDDEKMTRAVQEYLESEREDFDHRSSSFNGRSLSPYQAPESMPFDNESVQDVCGSDSLFESHTLNLLPSARSSSTLMEPSHNFLDLPDIASSEPDGFTKESSHFSHFFNHSHPVSTLCSSTSSSVSSDLWAVDAEIPSPSLSSVFMHSSPIDMPADPFSDTICTLSSSFSPKLHEEEEDQGNILDVSNSICHGRSTPEIVLSRLHCVEASDVHMQRMFRSRVLGYAAAKLSHPVLFCVTFLPEVCGENR